MWPRKQLDIDWRDLAFGLQSTFAHGEPPHDALIIGADWFPPREALSTLSVRSGWDLLLTALRLPPASEILMSAVTIPDMVRIVEYHGLVTVPIDVDHERLEPDLDQIERSISRRTKVILVAHLFGTRIRMDPIIELASRHRLVVVEDCAQAFVGRHYSGHAQTDCSLFSFGPIKSATALGGAVLRIRDAALLERMAELQRRYPVQSRRSYLARLAKYAAYRAISAPRAYGTLVKAMTALGMDYDRMLGNAAHSFGPRDFFQRIRRQPCVPLLHMLQRRLAMFESRGAERVRRRAGRGWKLANSLPAGMAVGAQNPSHTFWVMPVRVDNGDEVLAELRRAGFDATRRSSLVVVGAKNWAPADASEHAPWLAETIFAPNGVAMPDREWRRMTAVIDGVARLVEPRRRESAAAACITVPS